jgi:hypothetical protein
MEILQIIITENQIICTEIQIIYSKQPKNSQQEGLIIKAKILKFQMEEMDGCII